VTHYYVYYRIDPARLAEARSAVDELFALVARETGIQGRWMRRRDDPTTCMEVYEGVRDDQAFEALLERQSPKPGTDRHIERFVNA
jgi:hypothetical protein